MKNTKVKFNKKGSALIYVIILLVPVMLGAVLLMEIVFTDFTVSSSAINGQQALYNAEAGIEWGIKKLQLKNYSSDYLDYNLDNVYIMDGAQSFNDSRNCFKELISYSKLAKTFTIESTGKYGDTERKMSEVIPREGLLNLSRKISTESFEVSTGKVYFQIPPPPLGYLRSQERFLVSDSKGLEGKSEIYSFTQAAGISGAQRVDNSNFFQIYGDKRNRLSDISTKKEQRGHWMPYASNVQYFVSENNTSLIVDIKGLMLPEDSFSQGFAEYSGNYSEGMFSSGSVRVILIDGDLVLKGIRGDFEADNVTLAERFFNNLVIYCTGTVAIEDCDFKSYGSGALPVKDINLSIHSRKIDLKSSSEGNIINYLSGNNSLIREQELSIIEIIKANTSHYSNWTLGF